MEVLLADEGGGFIGPSPPAEALSARLLKFNDTNLRSGTTLALKRELGLPSSLGFTFLTNVTPRREDGSVATIEDMVEASQGIQRLGVLRMDLDDLGNLFSRGFGEEQDTLSRKATLSFFLRLFFEGRLQSICQKEWCNGKVYSIYSGGDDLFIIGSWDVIPPLAQDIHNELSEFVAGNPNIHISAGIGLVRERFPLYQAAELARQALDERAKERRENGQLVKDAIDFLGTTSDWEAFGIAKQTAYRLVDLIDEGSVPRGILSLLGQIHELYRQSREKSFKSELASDRRQLHYGRWMWLAAYGLSRLIERLKDEKARAQIEALEREILTPEGIERLGLASRWAELLTRGGSNGKER